MIDVTPSLDPQDIREIEFSYDAEYDLAWFHINERRSALTLEVEGGIYLRYDGCDVVGMELHGLRQAFLVMSPFARVFAPAVRELEAFASGALDEDIDVRATAEELPLTTQMLIFVIAHALATHEAELRAEYAGAARTLAAGS